MKKTILAIIAAGVWMNLNEFIRNELLLKDHWVSYFQNLGLSFPSTPINSAIWCLWTFIFCTALVLLTTKFSILKSTLLDSRLRCVLM